MLDDLHRPLGRDFPRSRPTPRHVLSSALAPICIGALLVGASAATALLQPALRHVDVFAEAARAAALAPAPEAAPALAPVPKSPTIVAAPLPDPSLPTITYPPDTAGRAGQTIVVHDPTTMRQPQQMAAIVDDSLVEPSDAGPLPVRGADGRRPFDVYSAEPAAASGTRVAIVVGGLGISQSGSQAAIKRLPPGVTFGFAPTGSSLDRWMSEARRGGHELVLQVPMEPYGYPQASPGPHTLTAADAAASAFTELHWSLAQLTNYVGVMNYMGGRLIADPGAMRPLLDELSRRGLLYLDDASSSRSVARDVARETGTIFAASDVLLDGAQDKASIEKQLQTLERVARAKGSAVGIASAFDGSIDAIAAWIKEAATRGIIVVPISALADDPENR